MKFWIPLYVDVKKKTESKNQLVKIVFHSWLPQIKFLIFTELSDKEITKIWSTDKYHFSTLINFYCVICQIKK